MRIAVSVWKERIAPVFDVAQTMLLIETEMSESTEPEQLAMPEPDSVDRGEYLARFGVEELICGAISRCLYQQVEAQGIRVHGFLSGAMTDLIDAWRENRLDDVKFAMPGCQCRRRGQRTNSPQQEDTSSCNLKQGGKNHARRRRNRPNG